MAPWYLVWSPVRQSPQAVSFISIHCEVFIVGGTANMFFPQDGPVLNPFSWVPSICCSLIPINHFCPYRAFIALTVNSVGLHGVLMFLDWYQYLKNCRLIINLEGMPLKQRDATSMIEFTSYIDIGDYTSEVQHSHSSQSSRPDSKPQPQHATERQ